MVHVDGAFVVSEFAFPPGGTLNDVSWLSEPVDVSNATTIAFADSGAAPLEGGGGLAMLVEGHIEVTEAGIYSFRLTSSDVAAHGIDGELATLELAGTVPETGTVSLPLDAGTHEITIQHLSAGGELVLDWMPPGASGFEPVTATLAGDLGGDVGFVVNVDTGTDGLDSVVLEDVPVSWVVTDGDNLMASDGGDIDLAGWDLAELPLSPPMGSEGVHTVTLRTTAISGEGDLATSYSAIDIEVVSDGFGLDDLVAAMTLDTDLLDPPETLSVPESDPVGELAEAKLSEPVDTLVQPPLGGLG